MTKKQYFYPQTSAMPLCVTRMLCDSNENPEIVSIGGSGNPSGGR